MKIETKIIARRDHINIKWLEFRFNIECFDWCSVLLQPSTKTTTTVLANQIYTINIDQKALADKFYLLFWMFIVRKMPIYVVLRDDDYQNHLYGPINLYQQLFYFKES